MFHKVKEVQPLTDLCLSVLFENGIRKKYDVKPLLSLWPEFQSLETVNALFQQVQVDTGGYGISWNDELDLASDELWENGSNILN